MIVETSYIVELENGVWLAELDGDPGRTTDRKKAKIFPLNGAKRALQKARNHRPFLNAKIKGAFDDISVLLDDLPYRKKCGDCVYFGHCKFLFGCDAKSKKCDYSPSRFKDSANNQNLETPQPPASGGVESGNERVQL
jgi:hypothetical protein